MSREYIARAIETLCSGKKYIYRETSTTWDLEWRDDSARPSDEEITQKAAELAQEWVDTEYQRIRANQYPNVTDQLDMLWHAMDDGALPRVDSFYDAIKAVKDANPKP